MEKVHFFGWDLQETCIVYRAPSTGTVWGRGEMRLRTCIILHDSWSSCRENSWYPRRVKPLLHLIVPPEAFFTLMPVFCFTVCMDCQWSRMLRALTIKSSLKKILQAMRRVSASWSINSIRGVLQLQKWWKHWILKVIKAEGSGRSRDHSLLHQSQAVSLVLLGQEDATPAGLSLPHTAGYEELKLRNNKGWIRTEAVPYYIWKACIFFRSNFLFIKVTLERLLVQW